MRRNTFDQNKSDSSGIYYVKCFNIYCRGIRTCSFHQCFMNIYCRGIRTCSFHQCFMNIYWGYQDVFVSSVFYEHILQGYQYVLV